MNEFIRFYLEVALAGFTFWLGRRFGGLDRYRDRDRKLYNDILVLLPKDFMPYYKEHDFGGSFSDDVFFRLTHFEMECEYPQNYFLDKNMEKFRKQLLSSTKALSGQLADWTVSVENPNLQHHRLPHSLTDEEHYRRASELNDKASKFYADYVKFITEAEKRLA